MDVISSKTFFFWWRFAEQLALVLLRHGRAFKFCKAGNNVWTLLDMKHRFSTINFKMRLWHTCPCRQTIQMYLRLHHCFVATITFILVLLYCYAATVIHLLYNSRTQLLQCIPISKLCGVIENEGSLKLSNTRVAASQNWNSKTGTRLQLVYFCWKTTPLCFFFADANLEVIKWAERAIQKLEKKRGDRQDERPLCYPTRRL